MKVTTKTINKLDELKTACNSISSLHLSLYGHYQSLGEFAGLEEGITRAIYVIIAQDIFSIDNYSDMSELDSNKYNDEIYQYCVDFVMDKSFNTKDLLSNINKIMEEN